MEIIPYLLGVVLFVLVLYWSAANATAKPGAPSFGILRYAQSIAAQQRVRKSDPRQQGLRGQPRAAATRAGAAATPERFRPGRPEPGPRFPRR